MAGENVGQVPLEESQILGIPRAVLQADVEVARRLPGGVVALLMHREGEDVGIAPENRGRAVTVMHVQIDDRRASQHSLPPQRAKRDRHVVDETEPLAVIGEGVVKAAAEMHGDALLEGQPPGKCRAARANPRGVAQRRREGHLQHELLLGAQGRRRDLPQVVGSVDERHVVVGSRRGLDHFGVRDRAFRE